MNWAGVCPQEFRKVRRSLVGVWGIDSLASGINWWERGTLTVNSDGAWTAAVTENDGSTKTWTGNISISPRGEVTVTAQGLSSVYKGRLDAGKSVLAWTGTWGPESPSPGTTEIKVLTRQRVK